MVTPPWTTSRRRLATLLGCTAAAVALLLPAVPQIAAGSSVARVASQLAVDTQRLADTRAELEDVRAELRAIRHEHGTLRGEVEARLVALYKNGSGNGALARMAAGASMADVGDSLDLVDQVADHDAAVLRHWQRLDERRTKLIDRRSRLEDELADAEEAVRRGRERLSAAERAAADARRAVSDMATRRDSPLLPKVAHPENTTIQAADGDDDDATPVAMQPIGFRQTGTASMYSDSFTGERTANGETYEPGAFTAAHPSLPFGTWVTVSGPGGTIAVRINDRGPFVGGRIIDLSRAAAEAIGLPGIGTVSLSVAA